MTVLLAVQAAAWAQSPAAASSLPIGSPLTIVSDETVDARVRPGSEFRAHLRDPLELDRVLVATAGTPARIIVTGKEPSKDGPPALRIAITGINLGLTGTLPVRPVAPTIAHIGAGTEIAVKTLAALDFEAGKVRVAVPLPFPLSNEPPAAGYTPAPLRTASPIINNGRNRRRPTPTPSPPPAPTASPAATATASSSPPTAAPAAAPSVPVPTPAATAT